MKKLIFALITLGIGTFAYGQYTPKGKVSKAETAFNQNKLDIAKAEVDKAFEVNAKGKVTGSAKNWYTRGRIYKAIYLDDSTDFKDLAPKEEALETAMEAFSKVKEMEKQTSTYVIFTDQEVSQLYGMIVNEGAEKYNDNDFKGAYNDFMTALVVSPGDTTALLYGGVSAQQAEMYDEALGAFQQLVDNGDANLDTYKTMIYLYRTEKEDMERVLKVVNQGLEKFPSNKELTQEKITSLIIMERVDEAKSELEGAIAAEPTNSLYYYFLGYLYDVQKDPDKSIENYSKAVELNPEYYEANYNLAVVYYEKARSVLSELNNLSLEEYRKQESAYMEKAAVHFKEALPYFEKAVEIKPDEDVQLLETLQGVYLRLHMNDKAEALDGKIKALSGQ
ncbi:MAG: tetratricopeptide repeat protein [Cytophagales bacterium]|nr:tetratricopeptide repeat protein [Cytophagales bacterium]